MKNMVYALAVAALFSAACGAPIKEDAAYGDSEYYSQSPEGLQEHGKPTPSIMEDASGTDAEIKEPAPAPAPVPAPAAVVAPAAVAAAIPAAVSMSSQSAMGSLEIVSAVLSDGGKLKIQAKVGNSTAKFWKRKWGYGFRFQFSDPSGKLVSQTKKVTLVDRDIAEGKSETVMFALKLPAAVAASGGSIRVALVTEGQEIAAVIVPVKVAASAAPEAPKAAKPLPEPEPLPEAPGQ